MPGDVERARVAGRLPASLRDLLRRCVLAGNWRRLHRYRRQQQKVVRRKHSVVTRTHAPAQVLRLGVEVTAIAVECVLAEDRGDLQRIGEFVSTLAPAHRVVEQAGDVKPLMPNTGAQWLAGMRIEPAWSPPIAISTSPAATSAALPDDDPPVVYPRLRGLCTGPVELV